MKLLSVRYLFAVPLCLIVLQCLAEESEAPAAGEVIGLTADKPYLHVMHEGRSVRIQRIQDPNYELKGYYARTARKCPPFCIQPEQVDPRVDLLRLDAEGGALARRAGVVALELVVGVLDTLNPDRTALVHHMQIGFVGGQADDFAGRRRLRLLGEALQHDQAQRDGKQIANGQQLHDSPRLYRRYMYPVQKSSRWLYRDDH